ncbi:MAG TPA: hypothetical protein VIX19_16315, partial [Terriglobales bacterium]
MTESYEPSASEVTEGLIPTAKLSPLGSELKVLLVWPRFPPSFWSFEGIMQLIPSEANRQRHR